MSTPVYRSSQPVLPRSDGWTNAAILRTCLLVTLVIVVMIALWQASDIILLVFLGVLFGLSVSQGAGWLARWRIPRGLGAALIVISFIAALFGIAGYVGPTLVQQTATIRQQLPDALRRAETWLNARTNGVAATVLADQTAAEAGDSTATASPARTKHVDIAQQLSDGIKIATRVMFSFLSASVSVVAGIGLMFVLALYVGAESDLYARGVLSLVPPAARPRVRAVMNATADTLRKWLVTQFIAMLVIGAASYVAFKVIGVQAAFALALIAGLLEFIPTLGPIISGSIAVGMAFLDSPTKALWVLGAAFLIQQAENTVLIPMLMKGGLQLPPALTLVTQGLMAILFGFSGLLVAVPFLAAVIVPIRMLYVEDLLGGGVPAEATKAAPAAASG